MAAQVESIIPMEGSSNEGLECLVGAQEGVVDEQGVKDVEMDVEKEEEACFQTKEVVFLRASEGDCAPNSDLDNPAVDNGIENEQPGDAEEVGIEGIGEDPFQDGACSEEREGKQGDPAIKVEDPSHSPNDHTGEIIDVEDSQMGADPNVRADSNVEVGSAPTSGVENSNHSVGSEIKRGEVQFLGAGTSTSFAAFPPGTEDGHVPLWIKWRGRWQAGIQCSLEDCPAMTMKAMPTYGRKTYIVVYFPSTRSFVWTDWQLVCPITDSPEPLACGSHDIGRSSVVDLNAARRHMMRKITAAMLDISDRLPIQAVVECARHVSYWKEFAMEAAKAVKYQELGAMLVTLKSMILPTFLKEPWLNNRYEDWKHQCEGAETAGSMERLIKELRKAVCWDEVSKLWDESEQTNLDSEWKTWKEYAQLDNHSQDVSTPLSVAGDKRALDELENAHDWDDSHELLFNAGDMAFAQSCKRFKSLEASMANSAQELQSKLVGGVTASLPFPANYELHRNAGAIIQSGSNTCVDVNFDKYSLVGKKLQTSNGESKSQSNYVRCSAFSEKKGRQCNKYASDGSLYCWKHASASATDICKKGKSLMSNSGTDEMNIGICSGMTKYGRRCTHKARDGSAFCLKHMLQDAANPAKGNPAGNRLSGNSALVDAGGTMTNGGALELPASDSVQGTSNRKRKHEQSAGRPTLTPRSNNWTRCIGWCRGSGGQCSHRAKPGFAHCEKHLPGSLGYGGKSQEKFAGISASPSGDDAKVVSRMQILYHEYLRARLADDAARNSHHSKAQEKITDWILSEVAGDLKASEILYNILTAEMDSLKKIFEGEDVPEVQKAIVPYTAAPAEASGSSVPIAGGNAKEQTVANSVGSKPFKSTSNGLIPRFKCKLCGQEFVELVVLGQHWRACHKKEAQQFFRGYTCELCSLPLTNKKGLERHWNAHHSGTPLPTKSLLVALCIICSGQFADFEDLWQHVIYSHPPQLCATWPLPEQSAAVPSASGQWRSGLEIIELVKCFHCDLRFSTHTELHQHVEKNHRDIQSAGTSGKAVPAVNELKYKCKICGLRFRLLPDLGRHHQAEHKPLQAIRYKIGQGDVVTPGLIGELNSNGGIKKEKKKLQKLDVRRGPGPSQIKTDLGNGQQQYNQMGPRDPLFTELEGYQGPKVEGFPSNKDILAVARFACCKNQLCTILLRKYKALPERLYLKAAKLCSEANVRLQFHREGYTCPNGCRDDFSSSDVKPSLGTLLPSASFVPLQLTVQPVKAETDVIQRFQSGGIFLDGSHAVLTGVPDGEAHSNKLVLCDDLSFGKEMVPIPCVIDKDVMGPCSCPICADNQSSHSDTLSPWAHFSYVTKRLLDPSLGLDTESSQLGCTCQELRCSPEKCDHVYLFDNDNNDARDIYGKPMSGRFPYDIHGSIILEEGYLVYECNSSCSCDGDCQNRVLQKGVRVKLEVYKSRHKGWAVRTAQAIARGTFVCEYIGEVLDDSEANRRGERYDKQGCSYLYDIDAHIDTGLLGRTKPFVIDATKYGNVARFINHSCSPNLVNYQVLVESMDCQLAHIGLYATRDIEAGEELAYDYRYKLLPGKGCPCHCGSKSCRGRLY